MAMTFSSSPVQPFARGAVDFLRTHDTLSALLPTLERMCAIQKDCVAILPAMFAQCAVLRFETQDLVLGVANTALAARLKQQLPNLQEKLERRGWQVSTIRIKVQAAPPPAKPAAPARKMLCAQALSAFDSLYGELEDTPRNRPLKEALKRLLRNQHKTKE